MAAFYTFMDLFHKSLIDCNSGSPNAALYILDY